jgi:hypothetical protein
VEKLLYPLWKASSQTGDEFREVLLQQLAPALVEVAGVRGLRVCVADSAVADGAKRRIESHPPLPDAMISLWVDYAGAAESWEPSINAVVSGKSTYLVAEAEPLKNQQAHPSKPGERMYGMCHVVFMSYPDTMAREEWLAVWKDSHTQIAIDTQSTFGYRQNLVVRQLGQQSFPCHAIVEENFPPEAMTSDHAFYATGGDDTLLKQNMNAMMASCARFIDFQHIDVIPMSEYLIKPFAGP